MSESRREGSFVTSDGAALWFEVLGQPGLGPAVFLDGLGCDGFIWRHLRAPISQDREVLHFHFRGHGRSGVAPDETRLGIDFCVDDLAAMMTHLGMASAVLFGHSMGVQIALEFHRRYPERVKALVLLCGSFGNPLDTWHDHSLLRAAFPYLLRWVEGSPELAKGLLTRVVGAPWALEFGVRTELNPVLMPREHFAPYMEHLAKMNPVYFVRTLDSLKDHSAWEHLPNVEVPALVVGGEIDKFTPVWLSERMVKRLPHSDYLFVPGGSHTAPLERPGLVNSGIARFLRERVDTSAP